MKTLQPDVRTSTPETYQPLKRRGLLAAGIAVLAGLVARLTETPVSAGVDGDVVLGIGNSTSGITEVTCTMPSGVGLGGQCNAGSGIGVFGLGGQYGVFGESLGTANLGAGVSGLGAASSPGVAGRNDNGIGVLGQTPGTSSSNTIAVYGQNYSTYAGPSPGAGGFAVYGISAKGHGLVGATATAGGAAVVGATNGVAGAYAGAFYGPVVVSGAFTVFGPKSAAVPHPDGTHRRLYCVESPESWFEDFGKGQLDCGCADVTIDPDFAAVANVDDYQVFLTEYDAPNGLYVTNRTPTGFRVQAGKDGTMSGAFGWRVVAKRRDIPAPRFETVTAPAEPVLPSIPEPVVPEFPQLPDMGHLKTRAHR
jgi:hypothetical protein